MDGRSQEGKARCQEPSCRVGLPADSDIGEQLVNVGATGSGVRVGVFAVLLTELPGGIMRRPNVRVIGGLSVLVAMAGAGRVTGSVPG